MRMVRVCMYKHCGILLFLLHLPASELFCGPVSCAQPLFSVLVITDLSTRSPRCTRRKTRGYFFFFVHWLSFVSCSGSRNSASYRVPRTRKMPVSDARSLGQTYP